jgi:hypothetical protein
MQKGKRQPHKDIKMNIEHVIASQQDELQCLEEISGEVLSQVGGAKGFGPLGGAAGADGLVLAGTMAAKAAANIPVAGRLATGLGAVGTIVPDRAAGNMAQAVMKTRG